MTSSTPFVEFAAGDAILREGEAASALYIIESGKVAIVRGDQPLAELGPGDFFGEMAILQESAHSASARAATAVRALRIDAAAFHGVLRENVEIAVQLMRRLVLRLQAVELRAAATISSAAAAAVRHPAPAAAPPSAVPAAAAAALPSGSAASASAPTATPASVAAAPVAAPVAAPAPAVAVPAAQPTALLLRHAGGEIAVPAGKTELMIGRPDPATGAIPEINLGPVDSARTLSRRHARLILANGRWMLREEPGVGNGTWVNGERLQPEQTVSVKAGDALRFGAIEVELLRD